MAILNKRLLEACKEAAESLTSNRTDFLRVFGKRQDAANKENDKELAGLMKLLWGLFSMYFQFAKDQPFGPFMAGADGKRTLMPQDLTEEELITMEELLVVSSNAQFVARISDVLWIRRRKYPYAQQAVQSYLKVVDEDVDESWVPKSEWLKRAIQIAMELGEKAKERQDVRDRILSLFEDSRKTCFNAKQNYWPSSLLELLIENKLVDNWEELAGKAIEIAKGFPTSPGCDAPRRYYEHAATCYSYANKPEKAREAKLAIAKHWENEAQAFKTPRGCDGLNLAHRIEQAIHAYREAGDKKRAEELVHELKEANKISISQMKVIKSPTIDAGPLIKIADDLMQGKKGIEAIEAFAALYKPFNYDRERASAEKILKEHPLQGIIDTHIIEDEGNVTAKIPSMTEDYEGSLKAQIVRSYNMGQNLSACTTLRKGVDLFVQSDESWKNAVKELVEKSVFVPKDRTAIFERALIAGFEGDYLMFTHFMIPQLENSIRMLFGLNKLKTTSVSSSGIQEERDLNQLLSDQSAETIFGKDLVWEMRSLLIEKCGLNLRNRVCHGLINSSDVNSGSSLFLLWLSTYLLVCVRKRGG
jgi:hypothetical protein